MKKRLKTIISGALATCVIIGATLFAGCAAEKKADVDPGEEQIYSLGEVGFHDLRLLASVDDLDKEYESQAIKITATVSGYKGDVPELEWYTEWSADGQGKDVTKYVTVQPFDGSNTDVLVTCLRPFDSTIYVVARVKNNPRVKAVCKVSYTTS